MLLLRLESEQMKIPENSLESAIHMGQTRGKMGSMSLIKMQLKSKMDRLLAIR